jgi:hypothetical protein
VRLYYEMWNAPAKCLSPSSARLRALPKACGVALVANLLNIWKVRLRPRDQRPFDIGRVQPTMKRTRQ